ncbi:hypothetical protein JTE90_016243 [Oedothorax gibbosus]|uniref:Chitin-binding type-4 domain-containing protein n=1 Tax=Oedothorax gibbosus TaxID=931172 RepID=A0AAV6VUF3_9ARAC|nr:hypothetical protein JTE90_016243 [Oedothorax gibbosus]
MFIFLIVILYKIKSVWCHARLMEPPSRSSMWRHGYETPKNYDDDGLYCGGMQTQWKLNGGKCGVCGDPWHLPLPRPNEMGGRYGNGIIVRNYKPGQVIHTVVDITANHRGYFEFRLCPNKSPKKEVSQDCLDRNLLTILNSTSTRYHDVGNHGSTRVQLALQLPPGLTCKHCVFQWTYVAGNNWGRCKNETFALGCGAQETFKSCADISIGDKAPNPSVLSQTTTNKPAKTTSTKTIYPTKLPTTKTNFSKKLPTTNTPSKPPKDHNKKKFPVFRPTIRNRISFHELMDNIRKDPRLRWMLKPKN